MNEEEKQTSGQLVLEKKYSTYCGIDTIVLFNREEQWSTIGTVQSYGYKLSYGKRTGPLFMGTIKFKNLILGDSDKFFSTETNLKEILIFAFNEYGEGTPLFYASNFPTLLTVDSECSIDDLVIEQSIEYGSQSIEVFFSEERKRELIEKYKKIMAQKRTKEN